MFQSKYIYTVSLAIVSSQNGYNHAITTQTVCVFSKQYRLSSIPFCTNCTLHLFESNQRCEGTKNVTSYKVQNGLLSTIISRFNHSCSYELWIRSDKIKNVALRGYPLMEPGSDSTQPLYDKFGSSHCSQMTCINDLTVAPFIHFNLFIYLCFSFSRSTFFLKLFTVDALCCAILSNNMAFKYCATRCVPDLW